MTHPERSESTTGGVAVRRVAGAALFWLLAEQAEEGGRKDELACSARGQTNFPPSASLPAYSTQFVLCCGLAVWRVSFGSRGHALPHFWLGVRSAWPWLKG